MTSSAIPRIRSHSTITSGLVACWLALSAASWFLQSAAQFSSAYAVKVAIVFAVIVALVRQSVERLHKFDRFGPANTVTLVRAALVAAAAGAIGETVGDATAAGLAGLGVLIALLDGVDGWLARRHGVASEFGARFDMETDALLVLVLSVLTWQFGKAGSWIVLGGVLRYLFVAAGWVFPWMTAPLPVSLRRKAVCVMQIAGLAVLLVPLMQPPSSVSIAAVLLATLIWSFAVDVAWLWRRVD